MSQVEQIARLCHEANRVFCESHGDFSQPAWVDAPEWQIVSSRQGVVRLLSHPNATPENLHESWLAHKQAEGWVYGDVKDVEAKTHPCMVPYDQLPAMQRYKDHLFHMIVRSFSALS